MPSLKDELLMYLKKLKKRDARQEMKQANEIDEYRIEGATSPIGRSLVSWMPS
jgi:hypothetical protein